MNLERKLEIAVTALNSITRHDDAPESEVDAVLDSLAAHVAVEREQAKARRAAKAETEAKATATATAITED